MLLWLATRMVYCIPSYFKVSQTLVKSIKFVWFLELVTFLFWFCSYLIKGMLSKELSFIAYTYAGELPSCAFGFNSHGLVKILTHQESV